jgi:2-keto-4-pentenoate hydratase/2-oxohepta-3-ene-1,7-dioic acid hydratase in catechol pathway
MKTIRYRINNKVKPGIMDENNNIRDASSLVTDWDAQNVTVEKLNEIKNIDTSSLEIIQKHDGIAPCVSKKSVGKIICIGLNYSDHAEETGMEVPPEPIIFFKATSAIVGLISPIQIQSL